MNGKPLGPGISEKGLALSYSRSSALETCLTVPTVDT